MAGLINGSDWIAKVPVGGTHTVSAAEGTDGKAEIATGKLDAVGVVLTILRSGIDFTASAKISISAGVLKVETNSSAFVLTAADVINWIVF